MHHSVGATVLCHSQGTWKMLFAVAMSIFLYNDYEEIVQWRKWRMICFCMLQEFAIIVSCAYAS
jgi:hypothetical protein